MAIFKNGEIYAGNKKEVSVKTDSLAALLFTDTQINDSLINIITSAVKSQTINEIIQNIVETDKVDSDSALAMIGAVLGVKQ